MTQRDIIEAIADSLGIPITDVDPNAHLKNDLGLNPIEIADLISNMAQRFGIIFDNSETQNLGTVNDIIVLVEDKLLE